MKARNYFIAFFITMAVLIGTYYYLEQNDDDTELFYCGPESRLAEVCLDRSIPVCGWFYAQKVQCFAYPCAADFDNECLACKDDSVSYYTLGECPGPG